MNRSVTSVNAFNRGVPRTRGDEPGSGSADPSLAEAIEKRLRLCEGRIEWWLALAAATPWSLAFAINSYIDNDNGTYRINQPVVFGVITAGMLLGTYLMLRLAPSPTVREMRAVLHDLRAEVIEETRRVEALQRRSPVWVAIGGVLLTLAVVLGVLRWLAVI